MGLYDTILLPTDGSAGTERAIEHAGELARIHDATVHALYVIDATNFTGLPMETSHEALESILESEGESALEEVERLLGDVAVESHTVEGSPSREIVRWTRDHDVDVVVMGTHGRGGLDRLLLGSVAERVVREAHAPVVTVRVTDTDTESADGPRARDDGGSGDDLNEDDAGPQNDPGEESDETPVTEDEKRPAGVGGP